MKFSLLFSILSFVFLTNTQLRATVFFEGSLQAAKEKAKNESKILMLKFGAKWCLPCRFMDKNVFTDQQVIEVLTKNSVAIPRPPPRRRSGCACGAAACAAWTAA
jgi:thioredoxin-related protein